MMRNLDSDTTAGLTALPVRPACREDFPELAEVLARAFCDDPVTAWFYPDDAKRMEHARRFFAIRLRQLLGQELIFTTPDRAGAALWTRPDRWREDLRQALMLVPMLPVLLPRILRSARAVREIERRHPAAPHYYLSVLGTEPERQGEGIGSALLAPVLERCDAGGVPAYLESSKESNVPFYARHGFAVTERMELPGGPPLWLMWRSPRTSRPAPR
jgi:GNAT superfamily N-acetyltransferase